MRFDPCMPEFRANPYPFYAQLQTYAPIFEWDAWGTQRLNRYDDCVGLLRYDRRCVRGWVSQFRHLIIRSRSLT